MRVVDLSQQNSLLQTFLAELRNVSVQTDPMRFRRNLERIGEVMAYELSKTMVYEQQTIQTPLASISLPELSEQIVLATIFRAGLPLHAGFLNYFDHAQNAFVSAYREYTDDSHTEVKINIEYLASPRLEGKTLIIADPMLATGGSMELAYRALLTKGTPAKVHFCSVIAAKKAVDYLQEKIDSDNATLWLGAVDPLLNEQKYIVPGLGDAGDLAFGVKE